MNIGYFVLASEAVLGVAILSMFTLKGCVIPTEFSCLSIIEKCLISKGQSVLPFILASEAIMEVAILSMVTPRKTLVTASKRHTESLGLRGKGENFHGLKMDIQGILGLIKGTVRSTSGVRRELRHTFHFGWPQWVKDQ